MISARCAHIGNTRHRLVSWLAAMLLLGSSACGWAAWEAPLAPLVSSETADFVHDAHEILFNVLLALIALHVAAVVYYHFKGRNLVGPMVTGRAAVEPGTEPMRPGRWWVALLCLVGAIAMTRWLLAGAPPFGI